eukprot:851370-Amphidinium_carterae.1
MTLFMKAVYEGSSLVESEVVQELDRLAVGKALKWLGHEASFELQQLLITEASCRWKSIG